MAEPLIEIENLKKYFPISGKKVVKAVDGVSFQIYKGESLGIVGESGCGKSTLGRCLIRLQAATDGTVLFHGKDSLRDGHHRAVPPAGEQCGGSAHRDVSGRRLRTPGGGYNGGPLGNKGLTVHH